MMPNCILTISEHCIQNFLLLRLCTHFHYDIIILSENRPELSGRFLRAMPKEMIMREKVCNAEIWAECFGRNPSDIKPADSYAIAALMAQGAGLKNGLDLPTAEFRVRRDGSPYALLHRRKRSAHIRIYRKTGHNCLAVTGRREI